MVWGARGSNQSGVRAHNERLVLTLIRQVGPLAKAEIARMTGLSAQTVSVIMRSLEADGLLIKSDPVRGKVGQPSVPMRLARDGAYFLGLKAGRRSLDLVIVDFRGTVLSRRQVTHRFPSLDTVVGFANEAAAELIAALPAADQGKVAGMGIAIPFRLWDWVATLKVDPRDMEDWRTRDLAAEIAAAWQFPIYLQNDASAACGAELVFGGTDKPSDFLYFFIGFFVGGGMVLGNALYTGQSGNAGALGPLPVRDRDGRMVQLVDIASLNSLETAMIDQGHAGTMIWDTPTSWEVPEAILDPWLNQATDGLAQAIYSACCFIDFEAVLIDGWMPEELRAAFVERTRARVGSVAWIGVDQPEIREGTIGADARALGAASLPLSDTFLVDRNAFLKG
ncbi:MAG: ROK family transcriptional regulator [Rhodobacteraceae bacterium]|nr:ROK family transcriptional regulator [Paracoccaceae bacterium]